MGGSRSILREKSVPHPLSFAWPRPKLETPSSATGGELIFLIFFENVVRLFVGPLSMRLSEVRRNPPEEQGTKRNFGYGFEEPTVVLGWLLLPGGGSLVGVRNC